MGFVVRMPNLLRSLEDEALSLVESDLPSPELLRPLLAGLVKHVETLETKTFGTEAPVVEKLQADVANDLAAAVQAETPAPAPSQAAPASTDLAAQNAAEIKELETRLAMLKGQGK